MAFEKGKKKHGKSYSLKMIKNNCCISLSLILKTFAPI